MYTAELVALSLAERLQAMEALWDSLCREQAQTAELTLAVIPAIYALVKQWRIKRGGWSSSPRIRPQRGG